MTNQIAKQIKPGSKVRYAVVAAGWISQGHFIPGIFKTKNSEFTVLITGDTEKGSKLAKKYNLKKWYTYEQFQSALDDQLFDAIYIATPNWMHLEYVKPALERGYHVLVEKPMEITEKSCLQIKEAIESSSAKLMVAYRLHCEPGTLDIIQKIREGKIGEPRYFVGSFSQPLKEENHRAKNGFDAGPVPDLGLYLINAARNVFGLEPTQVSATGFHTKGERFDFHDTVSITLSFPKDISATFTVSYSGAFSNHFTVVGSKGMVDVNPAFGLGEGVQISAKFTVGKDTVQKTYKEVDQFAGETEYFSDCIISNKNPEPDADEGWRDVRIICAIKESLKTGKPQTLDPLPGREPPKAEQKKEIAMGKEIPHEQYINCATPMQG